jgi:hypothetical protein
VGYGSSRTLCSAGVGPEALRFSGLASNSVRGGSVTRTDSRQSSCLGTKLIDARLGVHNTLMTVHEAKPLHIVYVRMS